MAVNPPDQSPPGTVTNIDTVNAKRDVYIGSRVKKTIHVSRRKSPEEIRDATNRTRMLARVRATWIAGVLDASLYAATRVELGLREAPEAVAHPWRLVVEQPGAPAQPLPPGTPMAQVFDAAAGSLLILGAPGAGKTTLLLELARTLLDRAEQDPAQTIPVVFHLASWAEKRPPLAAWLATELREKYQVPRKVAEGWVAQDQLLPLLDGLDEVAPAHRAACVAAINAYRGEHGLVPFAVCCRQVEYAALGATLALDRAVAVQPLTPTQVEAYLASGGEALAAVRAALAADPTLAELLDTPLMLSVLALAYHGQSLADLAQAGIPTTRRQVFAAYVQRMLARRPAGALYPEAQTQRWLAWLARQMAAHEQTVFYIERMQPDWLGRASRAEGAYVRLNIVVFRQLFGLACGVGGLTFGLLGGLLFGLLGLFGGPLAWPAKDIVPVEASGRSWLQMWQTIFLSLLGALGTGLRGGLHYGLHIGRIVGPVMALGWLLLNALFGVQSGFFPLLPGWLEALLLAGLLGLSSIIAWLILASGAGLALGFVGGLLGGFVQGFPVAKMLDVETFVKPGHGIRRSGQSALIVGVLVGLSGWFIIELICVLYWTLLVFTNHPAELIDGLANGLFIGVAQGLGLGLFLGLVSGLVSGLRGGGTAYIEHLILRLLLRRSGAIPANYVRFLDYAAERILLRKVGSGYIFVHRLLLEYFAALEESVPADHE